MTNVEEVTMVNIVGVGGMGVLEAVGMEAKGMAATVGVATKVEEEEGVITLLIIDVINTNHCCCTDRYNFDERNRFDYILSVFETI